LFCQIAEESNSEFSDWVQDAPGDYKDVVLEEFKKGNPSEEDIAQVNKLMKPSSSKSEM